MATESAAGPPPGHEVPPPSPASSGALKGRGRKEGPWARHFLRLDEHQSKTVYLSVCRFCLAAHTDAPHAVAPPVKVPARRANQIPHLKRCSNIPQGQSRADVDALLAAYGTLAVPYAAPGHAKDEAGADAAAPAASQPLAPRRPRAARASKKARRVVRLPEDLAAAATEERAKEVDSQATPGTADAPRAVQMESPSEQLEPPAFGLTVDYPAPQCPSPVQQLQQAQLRPPTPQVFAQPPPSPQALDHPPPLPQVLDHPPPSPQVVSRSSPLPAQQATQQSARQFQALVADVSFENGIEPEWVESASLKRLVRWLRPELERALPTADAISGSLLTEAAMGFSDANRSDMDTFSNQGAHVAVVIRAEDAEPPGYAALLRVFLSSLSASRCFDVRRILVDERDDAVASLAREIHSAIARMKATNAPVGSVCFSASERYAPALEAVSRENPHLIVVPCFADAINALASAVFRMPLIRSTLLAVAETIDAILSPPTAINETARAIPWQLVVFSTVSATYGSALELTRVESTRWTSAYESVASVLRVRSALREFAVNHYGVLKAHPVARNVVTVLCDDAFWGGCGALEATLRPLVAAARMVASGDFTLAHVMSTFTDMARSLQPAAPASTAHNSQNLPLEFCAQEQTLLAQMETVWSRYGAQRVSMLACFLHPETRNRALALRETELTSAAQLVESAIEYYHTFFGANEPTNKLRGDLMKWRNGTLVRNARPEEFDNWLSYWEYIRECRIAVELARLAIFVLSAGVYAGTCEELWRRRTFGSGDCGFDARRRHRDDLASLSKLKELEMARLAISRQRRSEWASEMKRHGSTTFAGQSVDSCTSVASATELPRVMMSQGNAAAATVAMDGGVMAHAISASPPRSHVELESIINAWTGYFEAASAASVGADLGTSVGVTLSDLVAVNSGPEASI